MANDPRRALITGASSGIGLELARLMAADGWRLVLSARDAAALAALATELGDAEVIAADLAQPDAVARLAVAALASGRVDALVNNAGFGSAGEFLELESHADMLQVNVAAPTELARQLVPAMRQRGRGYVLNVASVASFLPGPYMAVYYASKAYLLSWSEALGEELHGSGVSVTALCPGPTVTGFAARAGLNPMPFHAGAMDAATVAAIGYRAMLAGRAIAVTGLANRAAVQALRFAPRAVVRRAVARLQAKRRA